MLGMHASGAWQCGCLACLGSCVSEWSLAGGLATAMEEDAEYLTSGITDDADPKSALRREMVRTCLR